jgi:hypothetical protein
MYGTLMRTYELSIRIESNAVIYNNYTVDIRRFIALLVSQDILLQVKKGIALQTGPQNAKRHQPAYIFPKTTCCETARKYLRVLH